MHPVFQTPELRAQIFEHFSLPDYPNHLGMPRAERRTRRAALASLARCCHLFSDEALDILWSAIFHPILVLRLLPGFSYTDEKVSFAQQVLTSTGCERYLFYARRVRNLNFRPRVQLLSRDDCATIISFFNGQEKHLLPNLLTLHLDMNGTGEFDIVPYLAPTSTKVMCTLSFENNLEYTPELVQHLIQYGQLKSILVQIASPGYDRTSLSQVLLHSPNLTRLELAELDTHNTYIVDAIETVKPRLEVLICHEYQPSLIGRVLDIVHESLVEFEVVREKWSETPSTISTHIETGFPKLRRCTLKLEGAGTVLWEVIAHGPLPALQYLSLTLGADNLTPKSVSETLRLQLTHLSISPYKSRYLNRT